MGADAFQECLGMGEKNIKCKMGCQCMKRNNYYSQCKPPEGSHGCDILAAKALVKAAKEKAQPFIDAELEAHKEKNETAQVAAHAAKKAALAKHVAAKSLATYEKTLKIENKKRAIPVNAARKKVAAAKQKLK